MNAKDAPANRNSGDKLTRFLQVKQCHHLLALALILVMTSHAIAQSSPSQQLPEVYIGSVGNEVLLSITSDEELEGKAELKFTLEDSTGVASSVKIIERNDLSSLSKRVFAISFDIAGDIEPGALEELTFIPSSNQLISYDAASLRFRFRAIEAVEEEIVTAFTPPVFYLVQAGTEESNKLSKGYSSRFNKDDIGGEYSYAYDGVWGRSSFSLNMGFTKIPLSIVPGKPFEFRGKIVMNTSYSEDHHCREKAGSMDEGTRTRCATFGENLYIGAYPFYQELINLNPSGITEFVVKYDLEECTVRGLDHQLWDKSFSCESEEGKLLLQSENRDMRTHVSYKYRVTSDIKGFEPEDFYIEITMPLSRTSSQNGFVIRNKDIDDREYAELINELGSLEGTYTRKFYLRNQKLNIAAFYNPVLSGGEYLASVNNYIFPEVAAEDMATAAMQKTDESKNTPTNKVPPVVNSEKNTGSADALVKDKPLRTASTKPQGADQLKVINVAGMSKKEAEATLKGAGFKTKVSLGTPASSKKDSLKVEQTIPDIGSTIKRGAMVTIVIHAPFVDTRTVPEFRGAAAKKVISIIKIAGLTPKINMVKATSSSQAHRVSSLDPPSGTELKAGATVLVNVFGPYVKTVDVPSIEGLSEKAALKKLSALGLQANVTGSKKTDSSSLAGTIVSQMPEAGTTVKTGKTIDLVVYKQSRPDCKKWPGSAPLWNQKKQKYECGCTGDYEINSANSACRVRKSIQLAKTNCTDYNNQSEARWDGEDEKVYCYCNKGYKWNKDKTACEMSRKTIIANTDCSSGGYYGEAFWDYERNEASCRCKSGYKLNSSGKCVGITYSRVENDQPSDRSRSDDIAVQQLADDLMKIFGDKKKGSRNTRDTRTSQKTTRKKRSQNNCGSNFSVNGSAIDCKCAGWGFDPKYSQCRKGFSDKYSSKPTTKPGQVYAGFGNSSGSSGKLHACKDRSVRVDAIVLKYDSLYGGGETSYEMKGDMVCYSNSYDKISSSAIESYTCRSENFGNCSRRVTTKIERREDKGGGAYSIHFSGGNARWTINPK